jgi:hypothetical protein
LGFPGIQPDIPGSGRSGSAFEAFEAGLEVHGRIAIATDAAGAGSFSKPACTRT